MDSRLEQLQEKLERLSVLHAKVAEEISDLRKDLNALKTGAEPQLEEKESLQVLQVLEPEQVPTIPINEKQIFEETTFSAPDFSPKKADWEKYIGENLSSKIGIAILVLGVGIGTKYAIDHNILSPLVRVILGYLLGFALTFTAYWFKEKYKAFSAVLLGGSMAIHYFLTYFAYSLYGFIGQIPAFAIMAGFTVFTTLASIQYNKQVIAHIGLLGAYGVPFLLSDGSGKVAVLFSYMVLVNIGVMAVVARKDWRILFVHSFALSWLIFTIWSLLEYNQSLHFGIHILFSTLFFGQFYSVIYLHRKQIQTTDEIGSLHLILTLLNAVFFYVLNYRVLNDIGEWKPYTGLFTALNAAIHLLVVAAIKRNSKYSPAYFNAVLGMVFVFLTLAIPVQLDGEWVTLAWVLEGFVLLNVARKYQLKFYEIAASCLIGISLISLFQDWSEQLQSSRDAIQTFIPVFNLRLLSNVLVSAGYAAMLSLSLRKKWEAPELAGFEWKQIRLGLLPLVFVISLLGLGMVEIAAYWNQKYISLSQVYEADVNYVNLDPVKQFKRIWLINYVLAIASLLLVSQLRRENPNRVALTVFSGLLGFAILLYLWVSLYAFSQLRETLELSALPDGPIVMKGSRSIRYISLLFLIPALTLFYKVKDIVEVYGAKWKIAAVLVFHFFVLVPLSSELLALMPVTYNSRQLVLSLVWGSYSLFLVVRGISNAQSYLRIAAIALFGLTLLKVFLIDLRNLDTLSKTLVLVGLGILLLIISFMYNKYKKRFEDEE